MKRGDIYIAQLGEAQGCEQRGRRPVLVVQNNIGNKYSPAVIVAAITGQRKPKLPTHVELFGEKGIANHSIVLLEQLRTIDKRRLIKKVGYLKNSTMKEIDARLQYSLGLTKAYPLEITLCSKCLTQFNHVKSGKIWRVNLEQTEREACTYCGIKRGYDYYILD